LAAIAAGWDLIRSGKDVAGLVAIVGTLAGLVTVFVVGRSKRANVLQASQNQNNQ
jgi:FlaG/FlaF family flagellin (archaellin)